MASDNAGGIFFDTGANLDPLRRDLETMKAEAAKAGEEAGKASTQGFAQGAAHGGGAAAASTGSSATAGGLNTGAINAAAVGLLINQMVAVAEKFEKVGESVGSMLFEGTKQQLELTQAIRQLNTSLAAQQQINSNKLGQQGRGVGGRPVGTEMQTRMHDLEKENADITAGLADMSIEDYYQEGVGVFLDSNLMGIGFKTGGGNYKTDRQQKRDQIAANESSIGNLREQQNGLIQAGRRTSTGRIVSEVAGEMGIETAPGLANTGESMTTASAEIFREVIRSNTQAVEMLSRTLGSFQGQQQQIKDVSRQVTTQGGN